MFMKQMDNEFVRDSEGSWVAPLPFRVPRQPLPSNRQQALHRANMLDTSLNRNPVKREHFLTFMSKILDNNHAELAPPLHEHEECWYFAIVWCLSSEETRSDKRKQTDHSERNFINDKQSLRSSGIFGSGDYTRETPIRKIVSETVDWDQPLTDETADEWKSWRDTLIAIETLRIPRTYVPYLSKTATKELHVFSDASEKAIAAVAYLRTTDSSGEPNIGFILGKAKVAPTSGHTIPRLELSAAVLAVEITQNHHG
ncbi:Hypothetical predicted protein [Mytilus galloprovincialis]|uniref:Uncharacterized protein n=1 Tax=Mytilus galloprovincialis TaxID=29158 RepID=A0A8B6GFM2_MYTGA|nr:Hypothetical predicted protein [Mytilus galloprovincialis]